MQRLGLSLALTISTACSARDEPGHVAASSTRDSAGIRIIDSRAPAWSSTDAWTIVEKALLSIGTVDGAAEYQLSRVQNVLELSDGRIIVANGGTHQIICYSKDGRFLWASGRRGQGPGEYATLTRIARYSGDSILVAVPRTAPGVSPARKRRRISTSRHALRQISAEARRQSRLESAFKECVEK